MQGIQPRNLTNAELISYGAMFIDSHQSMPVEWQRELLRRFKALHPEDKFPPKDPAQLELF